MNRNALRDVPPRYATPVLRDEAGVPQRELYRVGYLFFGEQREGKKYYSCHMMAVLNAWILAQVFDVPAFVLTYTTNEH